VSPRSLKELDPSARRREIVRHILRVIAIVTILFVGYFLLPVSTLSGRAPILRVVVSTLVFVLVVAWLTRRLLRADLPGLRAIEVLAIIGSLFLILFAGVYMAMSRASDASFSEPLNHTGALYLAVTILSTVGFGDITPKTDIARMVVSVQMALDLVLISAVVHAVVGVAKTRLGHGSESPQPPDSTKPPGSI
jgi:voltage-gated potassium channel